jgi:chromosome segregation and condensation protein ScpB
VETALTAAAEPVTPDDLTKRFLRAKPAEVKEILETLAVLGRARPGDEKGTFIA